MSEIQTESKADAASKRTPNFMLEFGPILIFVVVYNILKRTDNPDAIFIAAAVFMVAAIAALLLGWFKYRHVSGMLVLTTFIIVISVGLSFFSGNPIFIYMKPTIVNIVFGAAVIGGVFAKRNIMKMMMGEAFSLPEKAWNTLAIRWGLFFFSLAALNEYVWRNFSESFWVDFKLFGFLPITLIFTMSQLPFILKHGGLKGVNKDESP